MRNKKLTLAASLLLALTAGNAFAAEETGKIFYKDGLNFQFPNFDAKLVAHIQPEFTFTDIDKGDDTDSFDVRHGALNLSGNLSNKQFSYMLGYDFAKDNGAGDMEDFWVQWNGDGANLKLGQSRVQFSRQELVNRGMQMFNTRSFVSDLFAPSWQKGAVLHGPIGSCANYYIGAFNGESSGEYRSTAGNDNKLSAVAAVETFFGDYGSRTFEGDHRADKTDFGGTLGVSAIYGQGSGTPLYARRNLFNLQGADDPKLGDFDNFQLNVDAGTRYQGWDFQTEFYYVNTDYDSEASAFNHFGFYAQTGYMIDTNWEVGGRYAFFNPDSDFTPVDNANEYGLVVNYFINGHFLKVTTSFLAEDVNFQAGKGDDSTNYKVITGFSALL